MPQRIWLQSVVALCNLLAKSAKFSRWNISSPEEHLFVFCGAPGAYTGR